jgi:hypothetical protein
MRYEPMYLAIFLAVTAPASAQTPAEGEPTKFTLSPAAAPSPALKYHLLPELEDQTPGNAALEYYRAFSPDWWGQLRQQKIWERIEKARQTPLKNFPRQEMGWLEGDHILRQVDRAARREYVDWGLTERLRREGIGLLLPELQPLRQVSALLAVRARLEIAERRYEKALYTLQTGLALARHVGEGVILIQELVGIALAQQMIDQIEALIQQPDAPNLYWALTEMPRPFLDLRRALQGEKLWLDATLPEMRGLETTRLTPEQQQKLLQALGGGVDSPMFGRMPTESNRLIGIALVLHTYPDAKKALIAEGRKPEEIEALPTLQVVLIHSFHQYRRLQDDLFKWYGLPYWEARPRILEADERIRQARGQLVGMPFIEFLPATSNVVTAFVRLERRIAALRCVEAIRLYAAAHDGKLPATLDTITEVPIPLDPMTGKAFAYRVSGDRATLSGLAPQGEKANWNNTLRYELTIRNKK